MDLRAYSEQFVYDREHEERRFDEIHTVYGRNKTLPDGFELQALLALSHFPELREVRIEFVVRKAVVPLISYLRLGSVFREPRERRYRIVISSKSFAAAEPMLLGNVPFDAQVGILGHEIAHTVEYVEKGPWGMLGVPLCSLRRRCREPFEQGTDRRAIDHGLGWQLYRYYRLVWQIQREMGNTDGGYAKTYMTPREILSYMEQIGYKVPREMLEAEPAYRSAG
ncbi:MAG: hypothetical protein ACLFPV_04670 [Spirochaetaceae bacterium]